MKKRFAFLILSLFITASAVHAQRGLRIGYIDMDYILKNIPEYQEANQQLNGKVQKWKSEIEMKMNAVDDMKQNLENERALLTKELIEEREEEIAFEEKTVLDYQQKRFGPEGNLIAQKRQLIQPVQDQVFNAVQEIGETRQYDFIFENSADALMLFSAKRHDISDQILNYIERSSRKLDVAERKQQRSADQNKAEEPYKSVKKASDDQKEEAEREAIKQEKVDERQQEMNERQRVRDSARTARKAEYEARRAKLLEERERKRDSIDAVRKQRHEERQNSSVTPPGVGTQDENEN